MVQSLNLSTSKHLVRVFYMCLVWFLTSLNYTTGQANTWLGCCTGVWCGSITKSQHKQTLGECVLQGVRCGSILPNLFELHYWTHKHLLSVFYWCSVWFDPSELLQTILLEIQTLCEGVLQEFGVVRTTPNTCRTP